MNFWNTINSDKVSCNILVDADVDFCTVKGAEIMWIRVPRADYKQRPVYINENLLKGTFKRNHEGDYHCSEEEVKAMLRDSSDAGNDGGLLDGYTMDDIDMDSLHSYRNQFSRSNPEHVWNGIDDVTFMKNMGGYAIDRNTQKGWLTTAGLLMFGKGLPIRERFDNIRMDYLDQSNLLEGSRWSDRLTYDGTWENNLYNFIRLVMPKLGRDIKRPFKLDGIYRVDDTPIHRAIREAMINLVIHSDFHSSGVLKVTKLDDGFLFSNPGNLKLPLNAIYEGGNSKARNPRIQNMLRMIGMGDNIGSGFPTILKAWKEENWRLPALSENADLHLVELKLWTVSLMPVECTEYLRHLMGSNYTNLQSTEQIILCTTYLEKEITNARLQILMEMHATDVGKLLSGLVQKNMLLPARSGRWTSYRLNEQYEIIPDQMRIDDLEAQNSGLIETDQTIYEYIVSNGFITTKQVMEVTRIETSSGASAALRRLMGKNLVKKERNGKQFIYVLNNEATTGR